MKLSRILVTVFLIIFSLGHSRLTAQLLVLPKFGASVTHFQELEDEVVYPMGGWGNVQPYFGLEVAYGLTNEWAVGIDLGYLSDHRDLTSETFTTTVHPDRADFSQWTMSIRAKRAFLDILFANVGVGMRQYNDVEFSFPEPFEGLGPESRDASNFLFLNVGGEVIYRSFVLGTNLYGGSFFGDNASLTQSIISADVYISYLFNIKVSRDPHWKKNCPKF